MNENANAAKIRALNDQFRKTGRGGQIMLTQGIQAMGEQAVQEIIARIADFDAFTVDNDPCNEHDFGNCLLYTSPSPRDGLLSRMPSSA